ncbi:MAG TPA: hypothetical protein VGL89_13585 [Candidatus Koribacter sp.]
MRRSVLKCFGLMFVVSAMLLWGGCGGSSTPSVIITPAAPVFTSVPPTVVQEGVTYTYQIETTVTDKSTVTYKVTTGPKEASISGSTMSWTPTHAEARTSNSFTITATTSNKGTQTQAFTLTPTGNINATIVNHAITGTGIVDSKEDLAGATVEVLFPDGKGGYSRLPGSGDSSGNAMVANVSTGSFYFHIKQGSGANTNDNYVWMSASDVDLGTLVQGREDGTPLTSNVTVNPNVTLKVTPATGDEMEWTAPDSGAADTVDISTVTNPFTTSFQQGGNAVLSSKGDRAFLLHYSNFLATPALETLEEFLVDTSLTETSGGSVSVSGTMTAATGKTAHPDIKFTQFDALIPSTASLNPGSKVFAVVDPLYSGSEGIASPIPLLEDKFAASAGDTDAGDLSFGVLSSSDTPEAVLQDYGYHTYNVSGGGTLDAPVGSVIQTATLPSASSALVPTLTQPLSATVDGKNFLSNQTGVSSTPQIAWNAPTTGTVTYYIVYVVDLSTTPTVLHMFSTTNNSVTVPTGLLSSGDNFGVLIAAVSSAGTTYTSAPFRRNAEYAETFTASGTMTVSSSGTVKKSASAASKQSFKLVPVGSRLKLTAVQ